MSYIRSLHPRPKNYGPVDHNELFALLSVVYQKRELQYSQDRLANLGAPLSVPPPQCDILGGDERQERASDAVTVKFEKVNAKTVVVGVTGVAGVKHNQTTTTTSTSLPRPGVEVTLPTRLKSDGGERDLGDGGGRGGGGGIELWRKEVALEELRIIEEEEEEGDVGLMAAGLGLSQACKAVDAAEVDVRRSTYKIPRWPISADMKRSKSENTTEGREEKKKRISLEKRGSLIWKRNSSPVPWKSAGGDYDAPSYHDDDLPPRHNVKQTAVMMEMTASLNGKRMSIVRSRSFLARFKTEQYV